MKANEILRQSAQHIEDRAEQRDQDGGERSMARCVAAFNALTGHQLSERDGWLFMVQLKAARATSTATGLADDYQDGAAYFELAGESVEVASDNCGSGAIEADGVGRVTIPPGYSWIAQDKDGRWYAYEVEPKQYNTWFGVGPCAKLAAHALGRGNPNENWKNTKRKVR